MLPIFILLITPSIGICSPVHVCSPVSAHQYMCSHLYLLASTCVLACISSPVHVCSPVSARLLVFCQRLLSCQLECQFIWSGASWVSSAVFLLIFYVSRNTGMSSAGRRRLQPEIFCYAHKNLSAMAILENDGAILNPKEQ